MTAAAPLDTSQHADLIISAVETEHIVEAPQPEVIAQSEQSDVAHAPTASPPAPEPEVAPSQMLSAFAMAQLAREQQQQQPGT